MAVLLAFLVLTILGALLGFGLAIADKKLSIQKDPKLEQLEAIMPGANCGGCGFAGCSGYAQAVFEGTAKPGLCSPGGQALANKMGEIMGVSVETVEPKVAFIFCGSNSNQQQKAYNYHGVQDCNAASVLFGGNNQCKSGCLHFGSCASVCEAHAISKDVNGNYIVDRNLCIGCGKCAEVCPNHVIKLIPKSQEYVVACNNHDMGGVVRKICETGCIGCKICEVKFPESGIKVTDNLAAKTETPATEDTQKACETCPRKCIQKIS